ncbi:restriction endonuclease subunit S [Segetibacter aerophilus]|uniref:Type I restriction modification DNA specificity domain-containing protein n=1 Tax=Segetibacter aerophilus TaxID=670293 RepID=A0A512BJI2_9BACT|nr:restriction endonuclease subunit S [Segetibacter aerophilus]GEO12035.1 hypothetical protein SAE01_45310 [Segetibacter aerophilus]
MSWKTVKIGSFLKERTGRYKPTQANAMGLKRVEKIDFSGTYHLVDKPTNTDMILVRKGDLLISGINAEKGAVTIYRDEEDALATIHYSSYEFDETKIYIDYFKWFLISNAFKNLLRASSGNGIKTELKAKHLLPLEVNLPPLVEQMEIVESINSRQVKLKTIGTEVNQQQIYLQLLRQTILHKAVQGKLTKQNLTDEPATELLKHLKAEKEKLIKAGKLNKEKELRPILEDEIPFVLPEGYSDDIVIVCSTDQAKEIESFITITLEESKVQISTNKTETFVFKKLAFGKQEPRLTSVKITTDGEKVAAPFNYLGFEFNGQKALIKSANLAKFYRRMISSVKRKAKRAKKLAERTPGEKPRIYRRQLYKLYTSRPLHNVKVRKRWKKIVKIETGEFRLVTGVKEKDFRSNYLSYVRRASEIMNEPAIENQIRKHKTIFNQAIFRHLKKD